MIEGRGRGRDPAPGCGGAPRARAASGDVENRREIDALGLPVRIGDRGVDLVDAAHHLVDGAEAELGHVLAHLLGDEEEEVDDVLGLCR